MPYCWSSIIPTSTANGYSSRTSVSCRLACQVERHRAIVSRPRPAHSAIVEWRPSLACGVASRRRPPAPFGYCRDVVTAAWIVRLSSAPEEAAVVDLRAQAGRRGDPGLPASPTSAAALADVDVVVVWADRRAGARPRHGPGRPGGARPAGRADPHPRPIRTGSCPTQPGSIWVRAPRSMTCACGWAPMVSSCTRPSTRTATTPTTTSTSTSPAGSRPWSGSPTTCACCARPASGSPTTRC